MLPSPIEPIFITDIETTGLAPLDNEVLQIGMLAATYDAERGVWRPFPEYLDIILPTSRIPRHKFEIANLSELYARCNERFRLRKESGESPLLCAATVRQMILAYCRLVYRKTYGKAASEDPPKRGFRLCGWNIGVLDVPFLVDKGYLDPGDKNVGRRPDFDYRLFELQGAKQLAAAVLGISENEVMDACEEAGVRVTEGSWLDDIDERGPHDAVRDCLTNLYRLNGLITLLR